MDARLSETPTFGDLLLHYRRRAGLSQAELAKASGVSVRAVRELEHGRARAAQRQSTAVLSTALNLIAEERRLFTIAAELGRQRIRPRPDSGLCALPPATRRLVGRANEIVRLRADAERGGVVVITGQPGVGKSALAVAAAHELSHRFADGCWAVDLNDVEGRPLSSSAVLAKLLFALGVPLSELPPDARERGRLYQELMSGRRVLLLLDNADGEDQIRPLVPETEGSLTIIISRRSFSKLKGVRQEELGLLTEAEALELVSDIVGHERLRAEPAVAAELVAVCGTLPAALRDAGNRIVENPQWSSKCLLGMLRDDENRYRLLPVDEIELRVAFGISYRQLSTAARRMFREVSVLPFGVFELHDVAAMNIPSREVRSALEELVNAGLLERAGERDAFRMHNLLRLFAWEKKEQESLPGTRVCQVVSALRVVAA
jgi:transcriptional regulator with XRE-family HTH domain